MDRLKALPAIQGSREQVWIVERILVFGFKNIRLGLGSVCHQPVCGFPVADVLEAQEVCQEPDTVFQGVRFETANIPVRAR